MCQGRGRTHKFFIQTYLPTYLLTLDGMGWGSYKRDQITPEVLGIRSGYYPSWDSIPTFQVYFVGNYVEFLVRHL